MNDTLIDIRQLVKYYPVTGGILRSRVADVKAVDGVCLKIRRGECLGLVGESGCGKTSLGKTILRLHEPTSGRMYFDQEEAEIEEAERLLASARVEDKKTAIRMGIDVMKMKGEGLRALRQKMQIVFQDPSNSLNPRMLIKDIVAEPLKAQRLARGKDLQDRVLELLGVVGMGAGHLRRYPHEFSGGQRQRIAIARSLATNPKFILMDEPTSALDVSVQAQILNLLKGLQRDFNLTYLFVTHHLLVVKYTSDRIAVMYLGKIVELAKTADMFKAPLHPYTKALLSAIPVPDPESTRERIILSGDVPNPVNPPKACRFHPRCPFAKDICREIEPLLENSGTDRVVACHRWKEL
jgi:oligopeptide/dipeptide ABC transporter ATP-binding protein